MTDPAPLLQEATDVHRVLMHREPLHLTDLWTSCLQPHLHFNKLFNLLQGPWSCTSTCCYCYCTVDPFLTPPCGCHASQLKCLLLLQEATDVYKRLLLEHRDFLALNVYVALCYCKLDYYDVSLEILAVYLQQHLDSAVAVNLKACNLFKLYTGKAAEAELKVTLVAVPSVQT